MSAVKEKMIKKRKEKMFGKNRPKGVAKDVKKKVKEKAIDIAVGVVADKIGNKIKVKDNEVSRIKEFLTLLLNWIRKVF